MMKKIYIILGLLTLMLFSGCSSSYSDFRSDCMDNKNIREEVIGHSWLWFTPENQTRTFEEDYEKLEKYCIELYVKKENTKNQRMDDAQQTGSTSSYARKYALSGLFMIDDNKEIRGIKKNEYKCISDRIKRE